MCAYGHVHNPTLLVRVNQRVVHRSEEARIRQSGQQKPLVRGKFLAFQVQRLLAVNRRRPIRVIDLLIIRELNGGGPLI